MKYRRIKHLLVALLAFIGAQAPAFAEPESYSFNVLNHRSVAMTAQYWNPILAYVSQKSGVPLELKLSKTSKENTARAESGAFDFIYSNHFFTPERDKLGYRVIARPVGPGIRSKIVVLPDSPVKSLHELEGRTISMPGPDGFTGYWLPMDALLKAGVHHAGPTFAGDQESGFLMLARRQVSAAAVNDTVLETFAHRTGFAYRVLWSSKLYHDLCIMAHPRLARVKVEAVRAAFVEMSREPAGRRILEAAAGLIKDEDQELGFVAADNRDYDDYRTFYRRTHVRPAIAD